MEWTPLNLELLYYLYHHPTKQTFRLGEEHTKDVTAI
jgi:hypothetical protein